MTDILMPDMSPTREEGNLAKVHGKVGDKVESGQVIAEIETDKATMEVEAVDEGVVSDILIPEGTEGVKVNTPIARLGGEAGASAPAPQAAPAPAGAPAGEEAQPAAAPAPAAAGPAPPPPRAPAAAPAAEEPSPAAAPAPAAAAPAQPELHDPAIPE